MPQCALKPSNLPIGSAQLFSIVRGKRHVARSTKHKCRTLREEKINKLTSVLLIFRESVKEQYLRCVGLEIKH